MDNNVKTRLYDVLNSVNEIESFFDEESKVFRIYQSDLRTKRAVERNIEIIGEAMSRILKENIQIQIFIMLKLTFAINYIGHLFFSLVILFVSNNVI